MATNDELITGIEEGLTNGSGEKSVSVSGNSRMVQNHDPLSLLKARRMLKAEQSRANGSASAKIVLRSPFE